MRIYVLRWANHTVRFLLGPMANTIITSEPPTKGEARLARLWSRAHQMCEFLETRDRRRYRVVHPGVQNTGAGPDFLDAVLEDPDGRRVLGDVELHIAERDWYAHGHHRDPNYNGVVLHVVLQSSLDRDTVHQSGTLSSVVKPSYAESSESVHLPRGHPTLKPPMEPEALARFLDSLGDQRFIARSSGFAREFSSGIDPDETLYRGLMEGLGYSSNRKPFLKLAKLVPWSTFRRYRSDPSETRVLVIQAHLLAAAGLSFATEPETRRLQLERLSQKAKVAGKLRADEWRLFRVRPHNHPATRIEGFARVLSDSVGVGLMPSFRAALCRRGARGVLDQLVQRPQIGEDRAREMMVNVLLPQLHSVGAAAGDEGLMNRCLEEYRSLRTLPLYGSSERFARSLGIPTGRRFLATTRRQQGLLHLQKHFADHVDDFVVQGQAARARVG